MQLNAKQAAALIRIRDHGSTAWCQGQGRAGGAVSRMFDRMVAAGLCTPPPYTITDKGRQALLTWTERPGTLWLGGWAGKHSYPVLVVGETPTRYRIKAIERTRLAGAYRWLEPGQLGLVPKRAVTIP